MKITSYPAAGLAILMALAAGAAHAQDACVGLVDACASHEAAGTCLDQAAVLDAFAQIYAGSETVAQMLEPTFAAGELDSAL